MLKVNLNISKNYIGRCHTPGKVMISVRDARARLYELRPPLCAREPTVVQSSDEARVTAVVQAPTSRTENLDLLTFSAKSDLK